MLAELREERAHIDAAIAVIARLAQGKARGRGRPPAWLSATKATGPKRRGRPRGSKNKPKPSADLT